MNTGKQYKSNSIKKLNRNFRLLNGMSFFRMFMIIMPIMVPFQSGLGMSMTEILLLQSVFSGVMFLTEIPSGYIADLWGRKNTLIIAAAIASVGWTYLIFVEGFWEFALFEVLLGIGASLMSGADIAMLYDTEAELNHLGAPVKPGQKIARFTSIMTLGEAMAALVASALIVWGMRSIIWAQAIVGWIPLILSLFLVEPTYEKLASGQHRENFGKIINKIFRQGFIMWGLVLIAVILPFASWLGAWSFQVYWTELKIPLFWFGILWAALNLVVSISAWFAPNLHRLFNQHYSLIVSAMMLIAGYLLMGLNHALVGLLFGILINIARGFNQVILRDSLNQEFESSYRATANSVVSFFYRALTMIFGPLFGMLIDLQGVHQAYLVVAAIYLVIAVTLILPWVLHHKRNMEMIKEPGF